MLCAGSRKARWFGLGFLLRLNHDLKTLRAFRPGIEVQKQKGEMR